MIESKRRIIGRWIWNLIFLYTLSLYTFSPGDYSYKYCIACTISYVAIVFIYFRTDQRKNFMDFDTMFFIAFFFVSFFYPSFIYPIDPEMFWMFQYETDPGIISKATALSLLGIVSYMYVSVNYKPMVCISRTERYKPMKTNGLFLLSLFSFVMYILLGGYSALRNVYQSGLRDEGGIYAYFSIIIYLCIFCMISIWFMNSYRISKSKLQLRCFPKIQVIYIFVYIAFMVFAGSRGKVLNILLLTIGIYTYMYKSFSLKKVLTLCFIGMICMFLIMIYRSGGEASGRSLAELGMDLIITNHNTFEAIDIVESDGLSFGRSMLAYILGVIPFLQNIFFSITGIDPDTANSAMIITESTLGTTSGTGTGSTIIADIYLAFGSLGTVILMGFLGWFVRYLKNNAKNNIYYLVVYGALMGMSVYIARAEFFYPAKTLLWCVFLIYLNKYLVFGTGLKLSNNYQ